MAILKTRSWIGAGRAAWGKLAAISALIACSACGVYQAGVRTGDGSTMALAPVDPASVRLFGGEAPEQTGAEVGFVVGVSDADEEWLALKRVRGAAAALGADAVVDLRFEVLQSSQIVARGRAIKTAQALSTTGGTP